MAGEGMPSPGTFGHIVASLFRFGSALRKPRLREAPPKAYPRQPAVLPYLDRVMGKIGGNHMGRVSKTFMRARLA
jgi:hypothetical protein